MPNPQLLHELLIRATEHHPESPAITACGRTRTYRELGRATRNTAYWLQQKGFIPGDRLILQANLGELPELIFACSQLGLVAVPLNEQVRGTILRHVMRDSAPQLVVTNQDAWTQTALSLGIEAAQPVLAPDTAETPAAPRRSSTLDPVLMLYTSGSTALPKAVVTQHTQAIFATLAIAEAVAYRQTDTVFTAVPMSFDYGLYQLFLSANAGCHLWIGAGAHRGPGLAAALRSSNATVLPAVPSMLDTLLTQLRRRGAIPSLRLITTTGAAVPDAVLRAARELLPQARMQVMYGLTECKRATIMPPDGDLAKPGSCGLPLAGTRVVAVGPEGENVAPQCEGELVVCGPNVMSGYWNNIAATSSVFGQDLDGSRRLRTGDFGYVDDDGYVYVTGRRDSIYKVSGFRVSAAEVIEAARTIPGVHDAALLPPAANRRSPILAAIADIDSTTITNALREQLEDFKIPDCVVVAALPLNSNGKADLAALADMLETSAGKQ